VPLGSDLRRSRARAAAPHGADHAELPGAWILGGRAEARMGVLPRGSRALSR
jgi:hypothetical protein